MAFANHPQTIGVEAAARDLLEAASTALDSSLGLSARSLAATCSARGLG